MPYRSLAISFALLLTGAAQGETITLLNGDTLTGTVIERTTEAVIFEHPNLGRLTLDPARIVTADVPPVVVAPSQRREIRVEAGLNGARGNSHNSKYRLGFQHFTEDSDHRNKFNMAYHQASSNGETDENEFYAELTHDWLLAGSRWFRFARGRFDWDEFEDWDSRLSGSGGYGYQFFNSEQRALAGRLGLGLTRTFGGTDDELDPEGLLGLDGHWQFSPAQRLEFDSTLYPRFNDLGEFRNISTLDWLIDIDQQSGLRLKLGIKNEYESSPEGESSSNDLKYDLSLQWQL